MKDLLPPILILLLLVGSFAFLQLHWNAKGLPAGQENPVREISSSKMNEIMKNAEEMLENSKVEEALKILEPVKNSDILQVKLMIAEAQTLTRVSKQISLESLDKEVEKNGMAKPRYLMARVWEANGEVVKAFDQYKKILEQKPPLNLKKRVMINFAYAALKLDRRPIALEAFQGIIMEFPEVERAFDELFLILRENNENADLDTIAKAGDKLYSKKFSYNFRFGTFLYDLKKFAKSELFFLRCTEIQPENPLPHHFLYNLYMQQSDFEKAFVQAEKLFSAQDPLPPSFDRPQLLFETAIAAHKHNQYPLAFKLLRASVLANKKLLERNDEGTLQAVRGFISSSGSNEEKAMLKSFVDYTLGDYQKVDRELSPIISTFHDPVLMEDGKKMIAECQKIVRNDSQYFAKLKAEEEAKKALKKEPAAPVRPSPKPAGNVTPSSPLGISLEKAPDNDPKVVNAKRFAELNPKDSEAQMYAGEMLAQMGHLDEAKKMFETTVGLKKDSPKAYHSLALIAQLEGKHAEMAEFLEKEIQLDSKNSESRALLSLALFKLGNVSGGIEEARTAVKLDPRNAQARLVSAKAYQFSNDPEKALEEIRVGLEIEESPDSAIHQALQKLEEELVEEAKKE